MQNVGRVKSLVDDLIMERGTVSMRVALVLRSAEVQPLFRDLCIRLAMPILPPPPCICLPPSHPFRVRTPLLHGVALYSPLDF